MKKTPRRVGRVLFALAGGGSAVFVHLLPAPDTIPVGSRPGSTPAVLSAPAVVSAPAPHDPPAPAAVPFTQRRRRAETAEAAPAASPVLAVDGSAAAEPATPRAR